MRMVSEQASTMAMFILHAFYVYVYTYVYMYIRATVKLCVPVCPKWIIVIVPLPFYRRTIFYHLKVKRTDCIINTCLDEEGEK